LFYALITFGNKKNPSKPMGNISTTEHHSGSRDLLAFKDKGVSKKKKNTKKKRRELN